MGSLEMTCHVCGGGGCGYDSRDESICFPKVAEGSNGSHNNGSTDCIVEIENGVDEVRISVETMERDCRICMMSLDSESGISFELGCSCKEDLAAVHQQCAEEWFISKGNNVCEICHSIAQNVVFPSNIESGQQISQVDTFPTNSASVSVSEVNTFTTDAFLVTVSSTNAVSLPISEVNTSSTNAILVPVSSTNTVVVPVSSTLRSRTLAFFIFVYDMVVHVLIFLFLVMFIRWLFNR